MALAASNMGNFYIKGASWQNPKKKNGHMQKLERTVVVADAVATINVPYCCVLLLLMLLLLLWNIYT
jgi:hypothetical protein